MAQDRPNEAERPFEIPYTDWKPEYLYSLAEVSKFFREIVENKKLYATKCPSCSKVFMPPRGYCPDCYEVMDWVPLTGEGTVVYCTYCYFLGMSGDLLRHIDVPYVYAFVKLDGVDTYLAHGVKPNTQAMGEIKSGTRVKAVFREERKGTIADFHFVPI